MRLADRFVGAEWYFPLGIEETKPFVREVARTVGAGPILLAQNVADYVDQRGETDLRDYPSLAPPWPSFWIEYPSTSGQQRRGVWVSDATDPHSMIRTHFGEGDVLAEWPHPDHPFVAADTDPSEVRWLVAFMLLLESPEGVWGPVGHVCLNLDAEGMAIGQSWNVTLLLDWITAAKRVTDERPELEDEPQYEIPTEAEIKAMTDEKRRQILDRVEAHLGAATRNLDRLGGHINRLEEALHVASEIAQEEIEEDNGQTIGWLTRALAPAYQTVAFLHCRNVEVDTVDVPPKVRAKRARRGKRPLLRYHTLRLVVPRKQTESDGGAETHTKALHIVAGHFAHYGSCCTSHEPHGLLFGRMEGVYWVASHVRGNADRGTVRTDFDLVAP